MTNTKLAKNTYSTSRLIGFKSAKLNIGPRSEQIKFRPPWGQRQNPIGDEYLSPNQRGMEAWRRREHSELSFAEPWGLREQCKSLLGDLRFTSYFLSLSAQGGPLYGASDGLTKI